MIQVTSGLDFVCASYIAGDFLLIPCQIISSIKYCAVMDWVFGAVTLAAWTALAVDQHQRIIVDEVVDSLCVRNSVVASQEYLFLSAGGCVLFLILFFRFVASELVSCYCTTWLLHMLIRPGFPRIYALFGEHQRET